MSISTDIQADRHIPLDGASNFRDFGGYPTGDGGMVRWGRLFRSDRLSDLTPADFAILDARGLRAVYDLRRESETALAPTAWAGKSAPALIAMPIFDDRTGPTSFHRIASDEATRHDPALSRAVMMGMYERMLTEPTPLAAIGSIFTALARPDAMPVLFHCAGGKDRTGVVCALIQSVLGVSRADVIDDFMLTGRYYAADAALAQRVGQIVAGAEQGFWSEAALRPIFGIERAYIETALALVDEAGGAEAFLVERAGVAPEAIATLRETLID